MTEVILFTQETCGACATQREKNNGLEDKYPDVEFREVDIQTDLETAEKYGVRKTPTTLVYVNGEQTAEFIGIVDRDDLESAIESATQQTSGLTQRLVDVVTTSSNVSTLISYFSSSTASFVLGRTGIGLWGISIQ